MLTTKQLRLGAEILVNLVLPWALYRWAEGPYGELNALIISSGPPMLWSIGELIWHRRVDALSAFVLGGIALSLVAMAMGGSPRLLLVRESLVSGLIGLAFLGSLLTSKPLIYYLARATVSREGDGRREDFEAWWQSPRARHAIRVMTFVWGSALTAEAVVKTWLAWNWPPERFLAIAPTMGYAVVGGAFAWTVWYRRRRAHHDDEADAEAESIAQSEAKVEAATEIQS